MRKPFYKKSHDAWYVHNAEGKLIRLAKTEAEAYAVWGKMQAEGQIQPPPVTMTTAKLVEIFLAWNAREENRSKATHRSYERALRPLVEMFGKLPAVELKPKELDEVCRRKITTYKSQDGIIKRYSESSRWQFYKATICCFNFGVSQGHIPSHNLSKIKDKPQVGIRQDCWIDQTQFDKLLAACDDPLLKDVLLVLWDTGARPFEIGQAQAKHIDHESRCLRFFRLKGDVVKAQRRKKNATRTIRLSDRTYKILCGLAEKYPEGPLLRNSWNAGWKAGLIGNRLKLLSKRAGIVSVTPYWLRHSYCTRLILANVNIRKVQELMGHSDLAMIAAVYSHLGKADDDLNDVVDKLAG